MQITYSLRLPRDAVTVPLVRTICGDALDRLGVTPGCQDDVALAVTEACANAVRHAEGHDYRVDVRLDTACCEIEVIDDGPGIPSADADDAMPAPTDEGGRGIALMKQVMDVMGVRSSPRAGTVVHLHKDLDLEATSVLRTLTDRLP